jgi:hypothetical protein
LIKKYAYYMLNYDGASLYAALAKLGLQQQGKQSAGRALPVHEDLDRALVLLEKARSTGEFKEVVGLDEIRREALLDPLRTEPRFQLLMMDLAFPTEPFAVPK